jgi:uncharacterized membrane protein YgdD (TMEM256/DUF423 family)
MTARTAMRIAALFGFLGVLLGAFGAHGFEQVLLRNNRVDTWHTAVLYHLIHAVVLLVIAYRVPLRSGPFVAFSCGIILFSGSLYLLSITQAIWLGKFVTPLGGLSFLAGWSWLALAPEMK